MPPRPLCHGCSACTGKGSPCTQFECSGREDISGKDKVGDLAEKKRSSSVIWKYFGFRKEDAQESSVLCRASLVEVATMKGCTTNMSHHLKQHHKALYEECMATKPDTSTSDHHVSSPSNY